MTTITLSPAPEDDKGKVAEWLFKSLLKVAGYDLTPQKVKAKLGELKRKYPHASRETLAKIIVSHHAWKTAIEGTAVSIPSNPASAIALAGVDLFYVMRQVLFGTALLGELYIPGFTESEYLYYKVFAVVSLASGSATLVAHGTLQAFQHLLKRGIKKYISKEVLKQLKRFFLKYLGRKITQRALIKAVPFIAAPIGGAWNYIETKMMLNKARKYLKQLAEELERGE